MAGSLLCVLEPMEKTGRLQAFSPEAANSQHGIHGMRTIPCSRCLICVSSTEGTAALRLKALFVTVDFFFTVTSSSSNRQLPENIGTSSRGKLHSPTRYIITRFKRPRRCFGRGVFGCMKSENVKCSWKRDRGSMFNSLTFHCFFRSTTNF